MPSSLGLSESESAEKIKPAVLDLMLVERIWDLSPRGDSCVGFGLVSSLVYAEFFCISIGLCVSIIKRSSIFWMAL